MSGPEPLRESGTAEADAPHAGNGRDIRSRTPSLIYRLTGRDLYRQFVRAATLLALDLIALFAAIWAALEVKTLVFGDPGTTGSAAAALDYLPFAFMLTALLFARGGLYGARESRPGMARVIAALFQVTVISLAFALVIGQDVPSYWLFPGALAFAVLFVGGLRYGYDATTGRVLDRLGYRRRTLLVGTGKRIAAVAEALEDGPGMAYDLVGFCAVDDWDGDLRDLGDLSALPRLIDQHAIEEVIVADPDIASDRAVELIDQCQSRGVRLRVAPSTMEVLTHGSEPVPGEALPLFEVKRPVFEGADFAVKRSFDFVIAGAGIIVLSPLLILVALAVKLTSRGPIIHRGLRPGIGGRPFRCLKFRTMYEDAEDRQVDIEHLNEADGAIFKIRDDPRLTPVGRFLRRNSIDELPQLLNVLRGEMSLVGPRPLPLRDHARLQEWHRRRYMVLPGITGLWQVSGRSNLDFDDMVRLDFLYLERWSVMLDLMILLKTIPAVIQRRGAY